MGGGSVRARVHVSCSSTCWRTASGAAGAWWNPDKAHRSILDAVAATIWIMLSDRSNSLEAPACFPHPRPRMAPTRSPQIQALLLNAAAALGRCSAFVASARSLVFDEIP